VSTAPQFLSLHHLGSVSQHVPATRLEGPSFFSRCRETMMVDKHIPFISFFVRD
jgi:hypothetical protein